ncbi:MAG TPA: permease prefix domain 1-containing protein, partial [Acidobacteriaceae bacterium]|nr:permease prefix domain 1-containing protein [Acidobacteriaceae bacterium]
MVLLGRIRAVVRNLIHRSKAEERLDAEARSYVDLLTEENIAAGLAPAEARRIALAQIGGLEQLKQSVRNERAGSG